MMESDNNALYNGVPLYLIKKTIDYLTVVSNAGEGSIECIVFCSPRMYGRSMMINAVCDYCKEFEIENILNIVMEINAKINIQITHNLNSIDTTKHLEHSISITDIIEEHEYDGDGDDGGGGEEEKVETTLINHDDSSIRAIHEDLVNMVVDQTTCSKEMAEKALSIHYGDVVAAILYILRLG
jgi:NACalpha-BTF3-like transcription factor